MQSWFQQLITCIETKGCDFEKKYRQTHNKLARLIDEINDVERNVKRLKWSLTHKCYSYLVKQIDNKIYRSSLTQDECLRIKNYKTFLHKLSLLPLTMDSFLETNHQDKPNTVHVDLLLFSLNSIRPCKVDVFSKKNLYSSIMIIILTGHIDSMERRENPKHLG